MKKWLIAEAVVLTFLPTMFLLQGLLSMVFGVIVTIFSTTSYAAEWYESLYVILPFLGGALGLFTVWRYVLVLSKNRRFPLDGWFIAAAIGGGFASWLLSSALHNMMWTLWIGGPTWLLVGHLLYLRGVLQRHTDQIDR